MLTEQERINASLPHMKSRQLEPKERGVIKFPLNDKISRWDAIYIARVLVQEGWALAWYLVRRGHLREEGSSAAGEYVFHLNWLWLHRLCHMNLVPLREKKIRCQSDLSRSLFLVHFCNKCLRKSIRSSQTETRAQICPVWARISIMWHQMLFVTSITWNHGLPASPSQVQMLIYFLQITTINTSLAWGQYLKLQKRWARSKNCV